MKNSIIDSNRFETIVDQFKTLKPIMIVGDVGVDKYTYGKVERISPEAPVPVLEVTKEWLKLGLAANISHNLNTLGVTSILCSVIGDDFNAKTLENLLEEEKLKTWGLVKSKERSTTFKERVTTNSQQVCRIDYETRGTITDELIKSLMERVEDLKQDCNSLILEDYAKGTLTEPLIQALIKSFKKDNKIVAVDPGRNIPASFYKGATLLKPNHSEAKELVKSLGSTNFNLEDMAKLLVEKLELEKLVITLGAEGMALIDTRVDNKLKVIPTFSTEVFDVSGAGDTVISVLTAALNADATLEEAAWIANCAAGVVVAKRGTATVNCDELRSFYYHKISKI